MKFGLVRYTEVGLARFPSGTIWSWRGLEVGLAWWFPSGRQRVEGVVSWAEGSGGLTEG